MRSPGATSALAGSQALNHQTLHQRVYDELRAMILSGQIPFGAQLDEQQIAIRLGVSRTPVREAIAKLAKEKLIEHRPWKGHFVRMPTAREVDDLYVVRKNLEVLAVEIAVSRITNSQIDQIRAILDEANDALARNEVDAYSAADRRFHRFIAEFAGNQTLVDVLEQLSSQIHLFRTMANRDPGLAEQAARERPQILAALQDRDAASAARLMNDHIEHVRRHTVAEIEELERIRAVNERPIYRQ